MDNRELAALIWLGAGLLWASSITSVRKSFGSVLRGFLQRSVLAFFAIAAAWVGLGAAVLREFGVWTSEAPKVVVLWFLLTGAVEAFRVAVNGQPRVVWRGAFRDAIGVSVLVGAVVALRPFPLALKLLIWPVLALFSALIPVAEYQEKPEVKSAAEFIIGLVALGLIAWSVAGVVGGSTPIELSHLVSELAIPALLSLWLLPFLLFAHLWMSYERLFLRIRLGPEKSTSYLLMARAYLVLRTRFSATKIERLLQRAPGPLMRAKSMSELKEALAELAL